MMKTLNIEIGSTVEVYHFNTVERTINKIEDGGIIVLDDGRRFDGNLRQCCEPGRDLLAMIVSVDGVRVKRK